MAGLLRMTPRAQAAYAALRRYYSAMVMATIRAKAELIARDHKATRVRRQHLMDAFDQWAQEDKEIPRAR